MKNVDLLLLSNNASQYIESVTCLECCKYYIAPETAICGHILCRSCWRGRRTCPTCASPVDRRSLRLNISVQNQLQNIRSLIEATEKLFKIKLNDFILESQNELESEGDPTKNVKEWLASSQNHFSAAPNSADQLSQDIQQPQNPLELSSNKIQIHTKSNKSVNPTKVIHISIPQDDWDKIEPMPYTEDITKNKEIVVGPMDIEPFFEDDNELPLNNPRRSLRNRELQTATESNIKCTDAMLEKHSSNESNGETDRKLIKVKQNWSNVKKMRKEFSKLNKKNRNKLNVSIEMCKKTQSNTKATSVPQVSNQQLYDIDDNTPDIVKDNVDSQNEKKKEQVDHFNEKENYSQHTTNSIKDYSKAVAHNQFTNMQTEPCKLLFNKSKSDSIHNSVIFDKTSPNEQSQVESNKMVFLKKGALCPKHDVLSTPKVPEIECDSKSTKQDDIEITIKVGNTIANIVIKKKQNDVDIKVNTNQEVQTSLGPYKIQPDNGATANTDNQNIQIDVHNNECVITKTQSESNISIVENKKSQKSVTNKSMSLKKNTASAETATAQFEITESVEKELSKIMECEDIPENIIENKGNARELPVRSVRNIITQKDDDYIHDLDIFDSESVKETNVQMLKATEHAPSEILVSTYKNKHHKTQKTQKNPDKREREVIDDDITPSSKKPKLNVGKSLTVKNTEHNIISLQTKDMPMDSESTNYDSLMGCVFANIEADIEADRIRRAGENLPTSIDLVDDDTNIQEQSIKIQNNMSISNRTVFTQKSREVQKDSENVFSICIDKDDENSQIISGDQQQAQLNPIIEDLLTPNLCSNLESSDVQLVNDIEVDNDDKEDDSDKSIVEDTPQKNVSFTKMKPIYSTSNKDVDQSQKGINSAKQNSVKPEDVEIIKSIVNLADTFGETQTSRDVTVIDNLVKKHTLETPLNINKFVDQIKHKSTPVARKSLKFNENNIDDDPEQTLCPTVEPVVKTTQEKEFMHKAFENTPTTPVTKNIGLKSLGLRGLKKFVIAGSCLTSPEIAKLKALCSQYKWIYVDKYTKDLTHLVVGVDEEKRAQRSVKYMCALASSKWIVSFDWVEKCLQTKSIVNEECYEALDSTGEPGPARSRLARNKVFKGITFYCTPPFSVLDVETLKSILEASGGCVVDEIKGIRVTDGKCALLLAEPENTQEDRFIYLAMEQNIVPVNYEWALNCLGSYSLVSIQELLLCPASLLPAATAKWPAALIAREDD